MTACSQELSGFTAHFSRRAEAGFTAGRISSDGGVILLREADRKIGSLRRWESCFRDRRDPERIVHGVREMLAQRIFGIAVGSEDLNDHEQLRTDPLVALLSGKKDLEEDLAGKSTLNRLELVGRSDRYHKIGYSAEAIDRLLVDLYLESHAKPPKEVVLDLDATDIPLYGHQPERFFHGCYDSYCFLPLYIFAQDQLLGVRLRPSNQDGAAGSLTEAIRIVRQLRSRWPEVKIVLRADSGFCREEIMAWSEANQVDFLFGLAPNERLCRTIEASMEQARLRHESSGKPARLFTQFAYRTLSTWSRERRVVAKAEHLEKGENPRFVVTSLSAEEWLAQNLYEKLYTLVEALRRLALRGTEWAEAQVDTLQLKLFKIGTLVRVSVRRVLLSMSTAYSWKSLFAHVFRVLRC